MKKIIFWVLMLCIGIFLVGCVEEQNRDIEATIKDHEVKSVIEDGKSVDHYYLTVIGDDFVAEVEVFPKVGIFIFDTFEEQFPLDKNIIVKEKDLKIIEGRINEKTN